MIDGPSGNELFNVDNLVGGTVAPPRHTIPPSPIFDTIPIIPMFCGTCARFIVLRMTTKREDRHPERTGDIGQSRSVIAIEAESTVFNPRLRAPKFSKEFSF